MVFVCPSCGPTVGFVTLAFYQIRDENGAKFKISYSCGLCMPKLARCDASINDMYNNEIYTVL